MLGRSWIRRSWIFLTCSYVRSSWRVIIAVRVIGCFIVFFLGFELGFLLLFLPEAVWRARGRWLFKSALVTALFALIFAATVDDSSAACLTSAIASTAAASSSTAPSASAGSSTSSSVSNAVLSTILRLLLLHSVSLLLGFIFWSRLLFCDAFFLLWRLKLSFILTTPFLVSFHSHFDSHFAHLCHHISIEIFNCTNTLYRLLDLIYAKSIIFLHYCLDLQFSLVLFLLVLKSFFLI